MTRFRSLVLVAFIAFTAAVTVCTRPVAALAPQAVATQALQDRGFLDTYCISCHNSGLKTAGLELDSLAAGDVTANAAAWEKVARALRTDIMPPAGQPRPDAARRDTFVTALETTLDRHAAQHPNPGRPALHRLNRTEYVNAIRDLFDLDVDARSLLPGDNTDANGFDNNADVLSVSPALMERYLAAASRIASLATGRITAADFAQYRIHKWLKQDARMSEDLPFGSRGGVALPYYFPVDGDYAIRILLQRTTNDHIKGLGADHELDVRVDDRLASRFTVGGEKWVKLAPPENYSSNIRVGDEWEDYSHNMDRGLEVRVRVKAGRRVVGVSFVDGAWAPEGIIQPQAGVSLNRNETPDGNPAVASVSISGPLTTTGVSDTSARRRVFVCEPAANVDDGSCARTILSRLARRAYRRPVTADDLEPLLAFYREGRQAGGFAAGVELAIERLLVSPAFLFRLESATRGAAPHRVRDIELASRLSFFLWSSIPDDPLLDLAERNRLSDRDALAKQVTRMLGDPRSRSLVDNFVGQWLVVRNLRDVVPDSDRFPQFDENLREAFRQETELFISSQIRDDRPILDLLDADYTFVNDRLARHYGIPNVFGPQFRRVTVADDQRRGLLGHGSILTVTSYPNRTSPVLRGKWVLENLLGTPPPPPPPNIPALKDNLSAKAPLNVRERLAEHRRNPSCATCHARMDPIGLALENFDAIGGWRTTEIGPPVVGDAEPPGGIPPQPVIDAAAAMPNGATFVGAAGLRRYLQDRREQVVRTVVEKLLAYALGRQLEADDAPAVRRILHESAPQGYRWSAVIQAVVSSVPFQLRNSQS